MDTSLLDPAYNNPALDELIRSMSDPATYRDANYGQQAAPEQPATPQVLVKTDPTPIVLDKAPINATLKTLLQGVLATGVADNTSVLDAPTSPKDYSLGYSSDPNSPAYKKNIDLRQLDTPQQQEMAADTKGAAERINTHSKAENMGVAAIKQADGTLLLTNVGIAKSTFDPSGQNSRSPLVMSDLITKLRGANSPSEAAPIMDNIRATVAQEQSKINTEALKFASNKLGIPAIESYLTNSELNDRASPSWFPGIGDSPGTQKIRTELGILRGQAADQAKQFLATNLTNGMLNAQVKGAEEELKRIDRLTGKQDTVDIQTAALNERKKAAQEDEATTLAAQLSPMETSALVALNPTLGGDPIALGRAIKDLQKPGNRSKVEAIKAYSDPTGTNLIGLSVQGNAEAKHLLFMQEKLNNPAMTEDGFTSELKKVTDLANSDNFAQKAVLARFGNTTSPEAKTELARLNMQKAPGGSAEDKRIATQNRIGIAIQLSRKDATDKFLNNSLSWVTSNPAWAELASKTQQSRGKSDFSTVMDAYMGDSVGSDALKKGFELNKIVDEAYAAGAKSVFGIPDISKAKALVSSKLKSISRMGNLFSAIREAGNTVVPSFNLPILSAFDLGTSALTNYLGGGQVQIDPTTGKPFTGR